MLVVFPLGLLATAVIFDVRYLITDRSGFQIAAAYTIAAGVIGGLTAALFGLIDWRAIPPATRAKRVGAVHGLGNVAVVALWNDSVSESTPEPTSTHATHCLTHRRAAPRN